MNLLTRNIVLLAIDAFGGSVEGKTLLQKRLYFLGQMLRKRHDETPGFAYDAHFYGPYSSALADDITTLVNQGFIREDCVSFGAKDKRGFELRKYKYDLTPEGRRGVDWIKAQYPEDTKKITEAARAVVGAGDLDYVDLSIAAKAHFILGKAHRPMTAQNVAEEAKKFSWVVEENEIRNGFDFLTKLGLAAPA